MSARRVIAVIQFLLIVLFAYTGITKLVQRSALESVLHNVPLVAHFSGPLAMIVPAIELVIAVLLIFPRTLRAGMYASVLLIIVFTGYILYMLYAVPNLPCSCGGVLASMTWKQHVWFNAGYIAMSLAGCRLVSQPST